MLSARMNFFGHAAIAAQMFAEQEPALLPEHLARVCAGAMLPDFVSMLGLKRPRVIEAWVQSGVDFHHRTDAAFHDLPSFLALSRTAFAWLSERELPRGPARAVAHIGIEMLLDEAIAEDDFARAAYAAALQVKLVQHLQLESAPDAERLAGLLGVLAARAPQNAQPPSPELLAERLRRTLSHRPRLATDDRGQALLASWVVVTRPAVAFEAPQLLRELRGRLARPTGAK